MHKNKFELLLFFSLLLFLSFTLPSKADTTIILIDDPLDDIACGSEAEFEEFISIY